MGFWLDGVYCHFMNTNNQKDGLFSLILFSML